MLVNFSAVSIYNKHKNLASFILTDDNCTKTFARASIMGYVKQYNLDTAPIVHSVIDVRIFNLVVSSSFSFVRPVIYMDMELK
jgi:hypothetical protein